MTNQVKVLQVLQVLKSLTVQRTVRPALILNDIGILSGDNGESRKPIWGRVLGGLYWVY